MKRLGFRILIGSLIAALIVFVTLSTLLILLICRLTDDQVAMPQRSTEVSADTPVDISPSPSESLLIDGENVIDDFSSVALWSGTDDITCVPGSLSLRSDGSVCECLRSFDAPINISEYMNLDIDTENADNIEWLALYLMEDDSSKSYFECDLLPFLTSDSTTVVVNRIDFNIGNGTPSWDDIGAIKLAFQAKDGTSASVTLTSIATHSASAKCSLWFDDGWKSTYSLAFPIMDLYEMPGILSVISSHAGYPDYCSETELDALYTEGWDLVNHTQDHTDLTTLTQSDAEAQITACRDYLISRGYTRAAHHLVPPYCAVNEAIDDMISDQTATSRTQWDAYNRLPVVDPYHIGFMEVTPDIPSETVCSWIDTAAENRLWLVLLFHSVETPADTPTKYPLEDFEKIISHLDDNRSDIETVTISQIVDAGALLDEASDDETAQTALLSDGQPCVLLWEDDFSAAELDECAWNTVNAAPFKNKELQTYRSDNISLSDGCLNIASEQTEDLQYYSGAVTTQHKVMCRYGRIDIRAKLPCGRGIFPAFWMLTPDDDELPEIDIVEYLGHDTDRIWQVIHYKEDGVQGRHYTAVDGDNFNEDFHIYSIEWTPARLTWLIDNEETLSITDNIPSQPMYLYINTAIGGNWPGDPDDTTVFPQILMIDYVRYYAL